MAVYPFIFWRSEYVIDSMTINHEKIHFEQQKEMLCIFFYILYLYFHLKYGYRNNPFEQEASRNEFNLRYIKTRKRWSWINYVNKTGNREANRRN